MNTFDDVMLELEYIVEGLTVEELKDFYIQTYIAMYRQRATNGDINALINDNILIEL